MPHKLLVNIRVPAPFTLLTSAMLMLCTNLWYNQTTTSHYNALSHMPMLGYMERAVMCHVMWLHVSCLRPVWSFISTHSN